MPIACGIWEPLSHVLGGTCEFIPFEVDGSERDVLTTLAGISLKISKMTWLEKG